MCPDATGGAALGRELVEHGDLRAPRVSTRERRGGAGHRGDHYICRGIHHTKENHGGAGRQVDAGHTARGQPLGTHGRSEEAQELGVAGDKHKLGTVGRLIDSHHGVAGLEGDDLEVGTVWVVTRGYALHHTLAGAEGDGGVGGEGDQADDALLGGGEGDVVGDLDTGAQLDRILGHVREVDR